MFQLKDRLMMATDGVDGSSTSTTQDLAELNDETTDQANDPEIEFEPEESDEGDEEESELTEPEEEEAEPVAELHPFERPSLKMIQEQYPDFFKKFPSMRDMYFREA